MREILFRAKRTDNGEWAESRTIVENISESGDKTYCIGARQSAYLYYNEHDNIVAAETTGECLFYACDPETIGQFTGLTDKNGKKIFEGDIVASQWCRGVVCYGEFNCSCCDGIYGWYVDGADIREYDMYEVIGNIHDNPELLEGE